MTLALLLPLPVAARYAIFLCGNALYAIGSMSISILGLAQIQLLSPVRMRGKIMGCLSVLFACGAPVGQLLWGAVLDMQSQLLPVIFCLIFLIAVTLAQACKAVLMRVTFLASYLMP